MKIILGRRNSFSSYMIRLFTWSKWSHVAIILEDGYTTIEATASLGVVRSNMNNFKKRYPDYVIMDIPATKGWQSRALSQIGKPYDWAAIYGIVLRGDWQSPSKWICTELAGFASGYFNDRFLWRLVPNDLVKIGKEVT